MKKKYLLALACSLSLLSCAPSGGTSSSGASPSSSDGSSEQREEWIILNHSVLTLEVGSGEQITVEASSGKIDPSWATYISNDTSVASVSESGYITAKAEGETRIHVAYNGASSSMLLTVTRTYETLVNERNGSLSVKLDVTRDETALIGESLMVPLDMRYSVRNNHKVSDGVFELSFSPNETLEGGSVADNFSFLEQLFNIQTWLSLVTDFSDLPGQYKAIGASYRDMGTTYPNETFYFLENDDKSVLASYSEEGESLLPRLYYSGDSLLTYVNDVKEVLLYLAENDLSSIDYVALINQYIKDGNLLDDSTLVGGVLTALGLIVAGSEIDKTACTVGTYEGVNFVITPKEGAFDSLSGLLDPLLDSLGLGGLDLTLDVSTLNLGFTIYTDGHNNTCVRDVTAEITVALNESYALDFSLIYEMGYEETQIAKDYFTDVLTRDSSFKATSEVFADFYEDIKPAVSFFVGDAPSEELDITSSYGAFLNNKATEYESLSSAAKFMLSPEVSAESILTNYNLGRASLVASSTALSLLSSPSYETACLSLATTSRYLNWDAALKEHNESNYNKVLSAERSYLSTISGNIDNAISSLASYSVSTSASDSAALFASAYGTLVGEGSLNYFANERKQYVVSELSSEVSASFAKVPTLLTSLYDQSLLKFKDILDSSSSDADKLSDLWTLLVGSGETPHSASYWLTLDASTNEFTSNGRRSEFAEAIALSEGTTASYASRLLNMNEELVTAKRIEGYSLYGTESWDAFVTEANALIDQIRSLETAIYDNAVTDVTALATLIAD